MAIQGEVKVTATLLDGSSFEETIPVEFPTRQVVAPFMEQLTGGILSGGGLRKIVGEGHVEVVPWAMLKGTVSIKFEEKLIQTASSIPNKLSLQ